MFYATDGKDLFSISDTHPGPLRLVQKVTHGLPQYCFNSTTKTLFKVSLKRSEIVLTPAEYTPDVLEPYLQCIRPANKTQAFGFLCEAFPQAEDDDLKAAVEAYAFTNQII
ncbi:MAG TPA: hypothetical protein VM661_06915 [Candidatus Sulfotelmatobacter sp.]|jgi:hypothetical protein|nr:hypothetical protein [Candidatus Sulfotelmatobacter sp.]